MTSSKQIEMDSKTDCENKNLFEEGRNEVCYNDPFGHFWNEKYMVFIDNSETNNLVMNYHDEYINISATILSC